MGLETLLEAAKFLEYQAEVEARGGKWLSYFLPFSLSSVLCSKIDMHVGRKSTAFQVHVGLSGITRLIFLIEIAF